MRYLIILFILFFATSVLAFNTSVDTGITEKYDKEKSQSIKQHKESKESIGKSERTTTSTGKDEQIQEMFRQVDNMSRNRSLDITLSLEALFLGYIAELEAKTTPFCDCRITSRPMLASDIGLSAEVEPGVIDSVKAQYIS